MSEFDAVDMDALLDEALDELDDNDKDVHDVHDGGVFDKKNTIKEMTAEYLSKITATNSEIISTQEKSSIIIENSSGSTKRVPFGPNPPPPLLSPDIATTSEEERLMESFQQMIQELSPDKINAYSNDQNADNAGVENFGNYLMEQIQSEFGSSNNNNKEFNDDQMKDAMTAMLDGIDANDVVKDQSSFSSFPSSNNKLSKTQNDKKTDNKSNVREDIGTKINPSPITDSSPVAAASSKNTKSSVMITDEEKILKGLFQGLMTVDGGGGDATTTAASGQDNDDDNIPNLDNLFQGMMNVNKGNDSGGNSDSSIPDDINADKFLDGMMEQLLSKELMYEPMKQVTEKFPSWLEKNKKKLIHNGEWDQRNRQYNCFQKLVKAYEEEDDDDTTTHVEKKTSRLLELMEQVQEYGQPPPEIINEIAPGLELDEEGLPIMSNVPGCGGMPPFMNNSEGEDCRIM